jgi:integrase
MITSRPPATTPTTMARCSGPSANNRTGRIDKALDPDVVYRLVRTYSAALGFEIGAHALRATAATDALDHQADSAKVQDCLGRANIATARITITARRARRTVRRSRSTTEQARS